MDKFSIESLFPSNEGEELSSSGTLDVNTLFNGTGINNDPDREFDSSVLLKSIYDRRSRLRKNYVIIFNKCCERIKATNNYNLTDIIYELPIVIPECPNFNHRECLEYIRDNLRKQYIDAIIIDKRKIFITWKYIELNKEELSASKE